MRAKLPDAGAGEKPGSRHYRAWIGATETYDLFSHMQFSLMTLLGLRQEHRFLDIGCGSLRGGKLFIVYLLPGCYFGIEPEEWLVKEGIARELGQELATVKAPKFAYSAEFPCAAFGVKFDYILAQSIFSHASLPQIRKCLGEARRSMHPRTVFAASFLEGDSDYADDAWVYPECVRYRMSTIERLARENGLACKRLEWFHSGGQTWLVFFLPGGEPDVEILTSLNQAAMMRIEMLHYRQRAYRLERIESRALFRLAMWLVQRSRKLIGK